LPDFKVGLLKKLKAFLARKDIVFSKKRYFIEALSAMALGLFSSLIIGLIFETAGQQLANLMGGNGFTTFLIDIGTVAKSLMGAAIGVSVAWGLKAPPLVLFASVITGAMGATAGGPTGAFVAAAIGAEFGKAVSKETRVDIIVTPALTLATGMAAAMTVGPLVSALMKGLGALIMRATELQPFLMGIVVSVIMGLVLTAPISSAALAIMMELSGLAGGAATVGCSAQMIGFAVISFKENGIGGFFAQGIGTSMLQVGNIVKNPWILLPPTLASAILGPFSTLLFKMTNVPEGAGMGTSGLVGQIGTITAMGANATSIIGILLLHLVLPAILALIIDRLLRKAGKIKGEDYLLTL
jgi:uncharacterized membrane protein